MPSGEIHWAFLLYIVMITIGLFSHDNLFAQLIKFFTGSQITHSAIGFEDNGKWYWLHAVGSGVQICDRNYQSGLVAEFRVLPDISNELELAKKKVGEPYADLTIVGFVIVMLAKRFGLGINNPFYQKSAVVCSEFVVECDTQHLIPEFNGLDPANITPGDLYNICLYGKSFQRIL